MKDIIARTGRCYHNIKLNMDKGQPLGVAGFAVYCEGGPLDGQWLTRDEIVATKTSGASCIVRNQTSDGVFLYRELNKKAQKNGRLGHQTRKCQSRLNPAGRLTIGMGKSRSWRVNKAAALFNSLVWSTG